MTELLQTAIYALTSLLLWPLIIILLAAVAHSAYLVGELLIEAYQRRHPARAITDIAHLPATMKDREGMREWLRQSALDTDADTALLLDRTEAALAKRIDRAKTWVRLGPALGLAGTLIPLGPALLALSQNDLVALSNGLVLAFGSTVLGLLAGGVCWVVLATQSRWYKLDVAELDYALARAREGAA